MRNPFLIGNGNCATELALCAAFCVYSDATGRKRLAPHLPRDFDSAVLYALCDSFEQFRKPIKARILLTKRVHLFMRCRVHDFLKYRCLLRKTGCQQFDIAPALPLNGFDKGIYCLSTLLVYMGRFFSACRVPRGRLPPVGTVYLIFR